jgi:hypothetical protein
MRGLKRMVRITLYTLGVLLLIVILHSLLVLFPRPLFPHKVTYLDFSVYSTREIPDEIHAVLDRAHDLLSESEINEDGLHHKVYLCNSYRLMRFLLIRNVHFGAMLPNGSTFITDADVENDIARCKKLGPEDSRRRTLSGSIVHEITHRLIRRWVGYWADRRLPTWIKEGYCDFIAQDSAIEPELGMAVLRGESWPVPGFANFRSRLMVGLLMNGRGMTFEEILDQPPDYHEVLAELEARLEEEGEQVLQYLR